jgi:glycosyltransferase involved in cell wall biosynthesis
MRIAYVLTSLGVGGAERQVLALAERMKARGHAVLLVVLLPRQAEEWPTALDLVRLDMRKRPASLLAGAWKARRSFKEFQPDLIHSHTFPANMVARLLRLCGLAPVVSTIHNVYEGGWGRMLAYRLTDGLSRHTTAVSQTAADRFARFKAVPSRKMSVVVNGIDTAEFAPSPVRRLRMREEMGVGDEFIWLAAGRIVPAKDYPNLLRAFARARAAVPGARLWIAGESDEFGGKQPAGAKAPADFAFLPARLKSCPDTSCAKTCESLASELGLQDCVRWLGLRRDMPALLDAADGFVLASAWEGMPLVVGEAMAMEKRVVATDVGGMRELLGEAGVIVPAKSPEALAEAMMELMRRTSGERHALGQAARQRIATCFSIDARADEWEALYRTVRERKR